VVVVGSGGVVVGIVVFVVASVAVVNSEYLVTSVGVVGQVVVIEVVAVCYS
jgi:hypothetical protein